MKNNANTSKFYRFFYLIYHSNLVLLQVSYKILKTLFLFLFNFLFRSGLHLVLLALLLFKLITPQQYAILVLTLHSYSILRQFWQYVDFKR